MIVDNTSPFLRRAWHPVAMAHEVGDDPLQVWLLGEPWVVVRFHDELLAFEDRCPHRLAPLSLGSVDDRLGLRCGYHGWTFDEDGRCTSIPAIGVRRDRRARDGDASPGGSDDPCRSGPLLSAPSSPTGRSGPGGPDAHLPPKARLAPAWGVVEAHDLVWLAPEEPLADMPVIPEWGRPGVDCFWNEPRATTVSAVQLVDNFLDASHFPFVHAATFGVDEAALVVNEPVERHGWTVRTTFDTWYRNFDDPLVTTGEHPEVQPQRLMKQGNAGLTVVLRLDFPVTGASFSILFACQPETADRTRIYKLMARDDLDGDPDRIASTIADELTILEEDLRILERYPAMRIHLDQTECHTRGDKLSVGWRRLLADMAAETRETPETVDAVEPGTPVAVAAATVRTSTVAVAG